MNLQDIAKLVKGSQFTYEIPSTILNAKITYVCSIRKHILVMSVVS